MAAAVATRGSDEKEESQQQLNMPGVGIVLPWQPVYGDKLKECQAGMIAVKDEFFKVSKGFGFNPDTKEYETTDTGNYLLPAQNEHFIGLVRLSFGGYYASIRVSRDVSDPKNIKPFELKGFIISLYSNLQFVEVGQYDVLGMDHQLKNGWQICKDDTLKLLHAAMRAVKDEFFEKAKEIGYSPDPKEYYPENHGICKLLKGGQHFIGLVKLSKPGVYGGYYASIRVSRVVGLAQPQPHRLRGFIIDVFPWLKYVDEGVFRFGNGVTPNNKDVKMMAVNPKNNNYNNVNGVSPATAFTGPMKYIPTNDVQYTINYLKNQILQAAGISSGSVDTFQIVSATMTNPKIPLLYEYNVKIYIGIDNITNFTQFIYVKYSISAWLFMGAPTLYFDSANAFPF